MQPSLLVSEGSLYSLCEELLQLAVASLLGDAGGCQPLLVGQAQGVLSSRLQQQESSHPSETAAGCKVEKGLLGLLLCPWGGRGEWKGEEDGKEGVEGWGVRGGTEKNEKHVSVRFKSSKVLLTHPCDRIALSSDSRHATGPSGGAMPLGLSLTSTVALVAHCKSGQRAFTIPVVVRTALVHLSKFSRWAQCVRDQAP